jgi:hypothetical protein
LSAARFIKFANVSNIDQPFPELEGQAGSITAPALGIYR